MKQKEIYAITKIKNVKGKRQNEHHKKDTQIAPRCWCEGISLVLWSSEDFLPFLSFAPTMGRKP